MIPQSQINPGALQLNLSTMAVTKASDAEVSVLQELTGLLLSLSQKEHTQTDHLLATEDMGA